MYGTVSYHLGIQSLGDTPLDTFECTSADEQYVLRIHLHEFLFRMLAASFRRHIHDVAFKEFQQSLLHTFSGNVPRDGRIVAFSGDLVNLVYEDYAALRKSDIVVGLLKQACEYALYILSYISRLCQHRGIDYRKRDFEQFGYGFGHKGLACTRRAYHQDIGFLQFEIVRTG